MIGEARETVMGLASVFAALLDAFRAFRRGKWNAFVSQSIATVRKNGKGKTAAQAYLAWIYGIRPIISDAQRIMEHWDEFVDKPVGKPLFVEVQDSDFRLPKKSGFAYEGKVSRGVSTGAYAKVINPDAMKFGQLGFSSPLSLAWELTTLSFVVDWFFHIGNFLSTWEGTFGVAIVDYWETRWVNNQFEQIEDRYARIYASKYTEVIKPYDKMRVTVRVKAMDRIGSPIPLPAPPYFSWGGLDNSLSRATSLFALFLANSRKIT
jgi:hypothetical protein